MSKAKTFQLPPFNAQAKCPKCGSDAVTVEYCAEPNMVRLCGLYASRGLADEHMHRQCPACRYEWLQACLAEPTAP